MTRTHREPGPQRAGRRSSDRLLLRSVRAAGRWLTPMVAAALILALVETALPAVLGRAVDELLGGDAGLVWVAVTAGLVLVLVVADAVDDVTVGYAVAGSTSWLRRHTIGHLLALSPQRVARFEAGDLASRVVAGASEAGRAGPQVVRLVANLVPGIGSVVALAWIDPYLAAAFLLGLPVLILSVRAVTTSATDATERYQQTQGLIAARLVEALGGARTIAASGTVDLEVDRVLRPLPALRRHGLRMWRTYTQVAALQSLLLPAFEIAVLAVAGLLLARGRITTGELVAASQYAVLGARLVGFDPLVQLARSRAGAARLDEVLRQPPLTYGDEALHPGPGHLELRGVTVLEDGEPVLRDIDVDVPAGSLIGVVGRTGSGASLLASVLVRLVDPSSGEVLLDGVPLQRLRRSELRRAVGYAPASPVLLGETVEDALAFGEERPSLEAVVTGARQAQAHGFVERLPAGYGTAVADLPLSGGEEQRLGLARAFAHAQRVLVLDDVTSSLDTVTEHLVREVLTGPLSGRTRVVVARRASTAAALDSVVWVERGRVRAVAPHAQLWADPVYRALFQDET